MATLSGKKCWLRALLSLLLWIAASRGDALLPGTTRFPPLRSPIDTKPQSWWWRIARLKGGSISNTALQHHPNNATQSDENSRKALDESSFFAAPVLLDDETKDPAPALEQRRTNTAAVPGREEDERVLALLVDKLEDYEQRFGLPEGGNRVSQRHLLAGIVQDLYASGAPTWVLEPIAAKCYEGLAGQGGLQALLLPNRCFLCYPDETERDEPRPGSANGLAPAAMPRTHLLRTSPGFHIARLGAVERVAVRLASFAGGARTIPKAGSTTAGAFSHPQDLQRKAEELPLEPPTKEELAREILDLAADSRGLFYELRSGDKSGGVGSRKIRRSTREVFSRLATLEAEAAMENIGRGQDQEPSTASKGLLPSLDSPQAMTLFRIMSSMGACGLWFGGSFFDMLVAGTLSVVVSGIVNSRKLAFEERVLTDVVASFVVGLTAGLLCLRWPNTFCFGAIALASVLDFMQGFKVLYAVIEVLSRNKVTGTARLLEGILFTGLTAYTMVFGLDAASRLFLAPGASLTASDYASMLTSHHGIPKSLYPVLLPLTATAWSALFRPSPRDLPLMAFHGIVAMSLSWVGLPLFPAAAIVTFSAGVVSGITGKQALANTLAGLYALVPGTYMMGALLAPNKAGFVESLMLKAVAIGLGGWTGTILCSPILLGKAGVAGLHNLSFFRKGRTEQRRRRTQDTMLYF